MRGGKFIVVAVVSLVTTIVACGSDRPQLVAKDNEADRDAGVGGSFGGGDQDASSCKDLRCQQLTCDAGKETTVSGVVYAPNGKTPLYNAIVYVPNAELPPVTGGATCDPCGIVGGDPIVTALSAPDGTFVLKNVPAGPNIPLVIQVGKWRRMVTLPRVEACVETKLDDRELTRLPKRQSEGSMPRIALTTGNCDRLGCMLPKVGIDASEFGTIADGLSRAVHTFRGGYGDELSTAPSGAPLAETLWSDAEKMKSYDMLILSCECKETLQNKGGDDGPAFTAMADYLKSGGRIFTTDYMYTWYRYSGDAELQSAASMRGGAPLASNPLAIDRSFPKGKALADWLGVVVPGSNGEITADYVFGNVKSIDVAKTQRWASSPKFGSTPAGPRVFSVNLPVGVPAAQQCGKGVHIDAHVNGRGDDEVDERYPSGCDSEMKPAENLLAFFFFDLASCIQDEKEPPRPPVVH